MNNFETHDAATDLAAGRTAYSLAREILGLRTQVAALRQEREENIGTLAAQDAILGIIANRLSVPAAPLRKPQGEKLIEALSRQCEELAQLRKTVARMEEDEASEITDLYQEINNLGGDLDAVARTMGIDTKNCTGYMDRLLEGARSIKRERDELRATLANMEAEEGKEITTLEQEIEAANDIASDLATRLDLVRQALGVPVEPHQSLDERLIEAAEGIKAERDELRAQSEAIGALCPTGYKDQDGLLGALLKIRRGEFGRAAPAEGWQPKKGSQELAKPPATK